MQNFTFGRKGTNWFLFAFIMLIGTLPSFGQEACPSLGNSDPADFCYLDDIDDLTTDTGAANDVVWYRDAAMTQLIPSNELLEDNTTYYAGNAEGDCTTPTPVTVTVGTIPAPVSEYGSVYSPYLESETSTRDIADLTAAIDSTQTGNEIVVYKTEYGTAVDEAYLESEELIAGQSYFVGQTSSDPCEYSFRIAIRYSPDVAPAPDAVSPQEFCTGATVADLEATGTSEDTQAFRWYSTSTSNPALDEDEELISGTYYVSQIVNDEGFPSPPVESEARTEVTVTIITFDAGDDSLGNKICQADLDARIDDPNETAQDILLSFKDDIDFVYESVSFSPTPQSIYNSYLGDPYQTFTTTATFVTAEGCEDDVIIDFTVLESYDAGEDNTEGNEVCLSTEVTEQEVEDYLTSLLSEGVDEGTFSNVPQITDDIQNGLEGPFNSTYTAGTGSCSDTAEFEFAVLESPNLQQYALDSGVTEVPLCNAEIPGLINSVPQDVIDLYMELIPGAPTGGTFTNMTINEIVSAYNQNNFQTFETTYTVTADNGCSDSIVLSYTIVEGETANAGTFDNIEDVCTNAEPIDLTGLTNNEQDATEGGTFSGEGVTSNMFDPSTVEPGTYDITYTVNESIFCVEGTDETTFTIEVIQGPYAGQDISGSLCISELEEIIVSNQGDSEATMEALFDKFGFDGDTGGSIESNLGDNFEEIGAALLAYNTDPNRDPSITIEGEYTVGNLIDVCGTDVSNFSITINDTQDANAGTIPNQEVCLGDEMVDLNDFLIGTDAMAGGTFTGQGVENNMFDPSIGVNEDGYEITYTVDDSADCVTSETSDSEEFLIVVLEERELGDPITANFCVSDLQDTYSEAEVTNYFASLIPNYSSNGTFEPTMAQITQDYNDAESKIGSYSTTYTLGTGNCEDSVLVTVTVEGEINAEAGDDFSTTFCSNEEDQDLYTFLSEDANPDGYFEGYEDGVFSPSELGAGVYEFNYVVDDSSACVEGDDTAAFSIEVFEAPNAGEDFSETICITEAEEMIANPQAALDWFNSIVDVEGVDQDGEFNPALTSLAADVFAYVSAPDSPSATFETTYTVSNENCEDSANISLTINNLEEANAGENVELTFCVSQGEFDLTDYLSDDANPNGYFEDFDGTINTSELGEGEFNYTYVVDETVDCVTGEDSVDFTVTIIDDLDAGADKTATVCNANIEDGMFPNSTSVRDYYLNMLDEGVSRDGTFSPSIQELVNWYNNESEIGDFTTTYTISEGECSDSAELTVTVYESIPAEIDPIDDVTLCSIDEDQDMFSFLPDGADTNGYFEGYEDAIFSPSTTGAGEFEVTYTLDETSPCVTGEASATFTITVLETVTAGEDMTTSFCAIDGEQDLYNFLDAEASTDGEFTYNDEVLVDGMFDASAMGAGSYDVTYTVEPINECGVATSILTVTVNEVPDAPAAPELDAFCAIEMATGADLPVAEGQTWYADAELTTMLGEEDMLVDGSYYLTVTSENGCESEATEVTVSVNDSPAPTISSTNLEFCDADNPTIAELSAEIVESRDITWYDSEDGTNALGTSTTLTSGTYYATLTGETGCESSQRLAVTVSVENCPILYPEAITPNGDGRNDTFIIENITNEYPNYSIEIFNRWGNVIYKGNASTPAWDGTSNQSGSFGDDVLPVGVYFYVIDFSDGSTEPKQGKVYLSR